MRVRLIALTCVVLAIAIAMPAVGAPSLGDIARKAAKALKVAKKANKGQKSANRRAGEALTTANNAVNMAGTAIQGPRVVTLSQDASAPPFDFAEFSITCPNGTLPVGISFGNGALELVFAGPGGQVALGSLFNPSTDTTYDGTMYVQCVESRPAAAASRSVTRADAREAMEEAQQQTLRDAR